MAQVRVSSGVIATTGHSPVREIIDLFGTDPVSVTSRGPVYPFWEIKNDSLAGRVSGYSDIHHYASNSGNLVPGGDLPQMAVGGKQSIWLDGIRGSGNSYTFRNMGGGLVVYETVSPTSRSQVPAIVPAFGRRRGPSPGPVPR
jgi:hypothetical protein